MFFASNLTVKRHAQTLFSPVSLSLDPGEGVWLQGANGSGKSSLLSAVAGLLPVESGELRWKGQPLKEIHDLYCQAMHYVGHELLLDPGLTIAENITLDLRCNACSLSDIQKGLMEWGLSVPPTRLTAELSAGQKQKVALLRLELSKAKLWLLDEPLIALDKQSQCLLVARCEAHLDAGGILMISSHQELGGLSSRLSVCQLQSEGSHD